MIFAAPAFSHDTVSVKKLSLTLNLMRWVSHFNLDQYILVNIPAATLHDTNF